MDDPILSRLILAFVAVVVYGLLRWRLMWATHEFRVRAGEEALTLARGADAESTDGAVLTFLAERAYRPTTPWLLALALLGAVLWPRSGPHSAHDVKPPSGTAEVEKLKVRLFWALISTSPLATLLALLVLVVALLWWSYVDALRDGVTTAIGRVHPRSRMASV